MPRQYTDSNDASGKRLERHKLTTEERGTGIGKDIGLRAKAGDQKTRNPVILPDSISERHGREGA